MPPETQSKSTPTSTKRTIAGISMSGLSQTVTKELMTFLEATLERKTVQTYLQNPEQPEAKAVKDEKEGEVIWCLATGITTEPGTSTAKLEKVCRGMLKGLTAKAKVDMKDNPSTSRFVSVSKNLTKSYMDATTTLMEGRNFESSVRSICLRNYTKEQMSALYSDGQSIIESIPPLT